MTMIFDTTFHEGKEYSVIERETLDARLVSISHPTTEVVLGRMIISRHFDTVQIHRVCPSTGNMIKSVIQGETSDYDKLDIPELVEVIKNFPI